MLLPSKIVVAPCRIIWAKLNVTVWLSQVDFSAQFKKLKCFVKTQASKFQLYLEQSSDAFWQTLVAFRLIFNIQYLGNLGYISENFDCFGQNFVFPRPR